MPVLRHLQLSPPAKIFYRLLSPADPDCSQRGETRYACKNIFVYKNFNQTQ